uniref:Reverse transcriptase/retrotransposon-derived protein RNase H-like domain-containing protein n=1 Tax=Tanacetum cinerariifolium TaxID=118510 RepID=A0A6L2MBN8_TANCI|nr:hypothetical protein [Tanacetum cinerariifolium]
MSSWTNSPDQSSQEDELENYLINFSESQHGFDANFMMKQDLTIFPKLYLPLNEDFLIIETDALEDIWGGILKAKTPDNDEKICWYTYGSFKAAEKNYPSNEKELLPVKNVISKFSAYRTLVTFLGITEAFCNNDRVTCKKFKSEESARISLATYSQEGLDQKPVLLRLKIQKIKEEHKDQRFKIPEDKDQDIFKPPMKFEEFRLIWNKARAACPEDFLHEKFFTTDKVTKSLYNFVEGADPKLIQQAFEAGLINNIYPSHNLQELRHFPQPMVDSIKNFRKKVFKAKDDLIYIKVISSVQDGYKSYHFLEIGLAKSKKDISQSQPMEEQQSFRDNLLKLRVNSLRRISKKILEVLTGTKKKVNYVNNNCIITSWSFSNNNEEDIQAISRFEEKFMKNNIQASSTTRQNFCRHLKQLFEDHYCQYCIDNNATKNGPSTEEESSTE